MNGTAPRMRDALTKDFSTPVHKRMVFPDTYDRLDMLWERYPQYHDKTVFTTLDQLLEEHESWKEDFQDLREEYCSGHYDRFLVQLG